MFYTVYKIINKVNGKFYIGCHKTEVLDDGYMGSGKILKRAIKKHGLENFVKEILHVYGSAEEMFAKEKELVYVSEETYNLKQGGSGGFDHLTDVKYKKFAAQAAKRARANDPEKMRKHVENARRALDIINSSPEIREKNRLAVIESNKRRIGTKHTQDTLQKMSASHKGRVPWNKGIPRSEADKEKISQGMRKYITGL